MDQDWLSVLLGGFARVRLLRLFLFNPQTVFTFDELIRRARLVRHTARTEVNALERAYLIRKKQTYIDGGNGMGKKRAVGYALNTSFPKIQALQTFLFETAPLESKTVLKHLRRAGKLDALIIAGLFVREFDQRLDVVVVGKKLSTSKIETAIRNLEAELGSEIRFAHFTTEDFLYRLGMYDKLTRDVFDYPHQLLIDRIGIRDALKR